ncbi:MULTISPECIES: DnaJ C-terminal domain-containing protein [unclassified Curtobacterium]|uniref:DnaJ C-terminal domain-containing protein n=1 Tax=unclassified Curtobacterium TaxID=257496 RepID=UPI000DA9D50A|nr:MULTISPECIES: DnaJ C-terminal domain-containing protein [unclassified Curtobacterium]PZE27962.1 J domain-containing protein [Curtobacterium sp. MCBD17_028]PZF62437.1 J domain-containing protein [Curtobacterium sp. MCBD17_034]PZF63699.1 J domain-containing protein [Curtobacterium sp. MCBD17_013]PZM39857.1 J domain-containing protein [Curtobacterium sp. MCBD17_031]WIB67906.1 DnaJ C-terminal domain-containing protein [Curtobacterium sp. MCBD17_035]
MASQDWFDKDFYAVLGVSKDASDADIKKTYRKLARQYHPDSNPGNASAEAKFKEISEAYSVLSDKEQRAEYDQIRAMGSGARFTAGAPGGAGGFEDVFGGMFGGGGGGQRVRFGQGGGGGFEDILGGMFGGGGGFGQSSGGYRGFGGPTKGRDVTASTTLDFTTAIAGDTVKLTQGSGRPVNVRIPAGVADGQKIRLKGRGEPSPDGGEAGDLVVTVQVRKHPVFERDGLNLRVDVPVTFVEAALGATIEVPTLGGGPVKLRVAPGTPSGRVLRVKGRGVTTKNGTGDLLATVQVAVPSHLTPSAREAVEALATALPAENPRDDLIARARES